MCSFLVSLDPWCAQLPSRGHPHGAICASSRGTTAADGREEGNEAAIVAATVKSVPAVRQCGTYLQAMAW